MDGPSKKKQKMSLRHYISSGKHDAKLCFICVQNKKKFGTKVPLCTVQSDETENSIKQLLLELADDSVLDRIAGMSLLGAMYHKRCLSTKHVTSSRKENIEVRNEIIDQIPGVVDSAFQTVVSFIDESIIENAKIVSMSYIVNMYREKSGAIAYKGCRLKSRLLGHFGDSIVFERPSDQSKPELLYKRGMKIQSVLMSVDAEMEDIEEINSSVAGGGDGASIAVKETVASDTTTVFQASKVLRSLLLDVTPRLSWPPRPEEINSSVANALIPSLVHNALVWILTDKDEISTEKLSVDSHTEKKVQSLGQDLLYTTTGGNLKTPKHVGMSVATKSLTGSKREVTTLNRLGHGMAYTQVVQMENAIIRQKAAHENGLSIPSTCVPGVFASFAWDNNDIPEETLDGKGTTHCTTGIVVQRQVQGCLPPPQVDRETKESLKYTVEDLFTQLEVCDKKPRADFPSAHYRRHFSEYIDVADEVLKKADLQDLAWLLARYRRDNDQKVPSWTPFMALDKDPPPQSVIGYLPIIDQSPTKEDTVYTLLTTSIKIGKELGQDKVVVVFDQAIYAKALALMWKHKELADHVILRLGAFHTCMNFMSLIGKRFSEAGLSDLLVESGMMSRGSLPSVLSGHHYNKAVRVLKLLLECMFRLHFSAFLESIDHDEKQALLVQKVLDTAREVQVNCTADSRKQLNDLPELNDLFILYNKYKEGNKGPNAEFWLSFIDMVSVLLKFIRATREGNWDLHLACLQAMVPWFFAYDHINYARCVSVYICDMKNLETSDPEIYHSLQNGGFTVQRSEHSFAQVSFDQTIEQTVNRDTKTKGGIIGFSTRKESVGKWVHTAPERAAITQKFLDMLDMHGDEESEHKEARSQRMSKDEKDISEAVMMCQNWGNPFEESCHLTSLSSGITASSKVTTDLMDAYKIGKQAHERFLQERLQKKSTPYTSSLKKLKLSTFQDMAKVSSKETGEDSMNSDQELFSRLLAISQTRSIDLKDIFKHELGLYPRSMAKPNGHPHKPDKSKLAGILLQGVQDIEDIPYSAAWIYDGLALLHGITSVPETFEELASMVFWLMYSQNSDRSRSDFVCDDHPRKTIKVYEREKRSAGSFIVQIRNGKQRTPDQWEKYLRNGENKDTLVRFLLQEWQHEKYQQRLEQRSLYVSHEGKCYLITSTGCKIVEPLNNNHIEADTRMMLHANHAAQQGHHTIIIRSADTDVLVLGTYFAKQIPTNMFIHRRTATSCKYYDLRAVADKLGPDLCAALPGFHSFTGSDCTSGFFGVGKPTAFKVLNKDPEFQAAMKSLGTSATISKAVSDFCERYVISMYDTSGISVDEVRYTMYLARPTINTCRLPPTKDALVLHTQRCNYQAMVWREALTSFPDIPDATSCGWRELNGDLQITWTTLSPAPQSAMQLVLCKCKGNCSNMKCTCKRSGLPCTHACKCTDGCCNSVHDESSDSEDEQ